MSTLRKRGGSYEIDYRVNGKRFRKAVGRSKKMAELALKDLEVKIAKGQLGFDTKDHDFNKLVEEFKEHSRTNLALNTQKRYGAILDNFERFLSNKHPYIQRVSDFTPILFEDYKAYRKGEGAENRTINPELITIGKMFRLSVKWGYIEKSPIAGVEKLKISKKVSPKFLTAEQCRMLLEACDDWLYPIMYAFLNTGMRKSELENLNWEDIDWDRKKIKIR
ncbi:MAG: hypothetical protein EOM23_03900, partial [Candidatus Moranbacteria bacterium]|nr:hypothetical protein [Candidatus Moranbacteria bacterium]